MEVFKDYAYYYNMFYQDKDYKKEAEQIDNLLKKYEGGVHKIINFGCGTGRHDVELTKMGYICKGIDMSPLMVEIARKNAKKEGVIIDFEVEDICNYESREKYDAVISLFHVMSYQKKNAEILSAFQRARNVLDVGGTFIFDTWYGPGVLSDKPVVRVKEVEDSENRLIRIARPIMHDKENVVDVNYEVLIINKKTDKVQTIKEVHNMRYFFGPEIEKLLGEAGFELVEQLDCHTLKNTSFNSWTSYFIARAV